MPPEFSLEGKTALITGAGRGIGTGIAEVFAEAGATVVVNSLTDLYLQPFTEALQQRSKNRVIAIAGDITTPEGAMRLIDQAMQSAGAIDILVNNLGDHIPANLVPLPDDDGAASDEQVQKILALNLMGTIHCTRAAGPAMIARRKGKVINISSIGALRGMTKSTIYGAGKAAVEGFTRSLAVEWAPYGITVNVISPGVFPNPASLSAEQMDYVRDVIVPKIPLKRVGALREMGLLALYLASDAANYMTGQVICLDGGMSV